jgi:hypothetical protein
MRESPVDRSNFEFGAPDPIGKVRAPLSTKIACDDPGDESEKLWKTLPLPPARTIGKDCTTRSVTARLESLLVSPGILPRPYVSLASAAARQRIARQVLGAIE